MIRAEGLKVIEECNGTETVLATATDWTTAMWLAEVVNKYLENMLRDTHINEDYVKVQKPDIANRWLGYVCLASGVAIATAIVVRFILK